MALHRLAHAEQAAEVVGVVGQRLRDRFAHRLEGGEVHHGVDAVALRTALPAPPRRRRRRARTPARWPEQFAQPVQHLGRAVGEVVDADDAEAGGQQRQPGVRADVAGGAGEQDGGHAAWLSSVGIVWRRVGPCARHAPRQRACARCPPPEPEQARERCLQSDNASQSCTPCSRRRWSSASRWSSTTCSAASRWPPSACGRTPAATLALQLAGWPRLLPPPPTLAFRVTPAGLLDWCGAQARRRARPGGADRRHQPGAAAGPGAGRRAAAGADRRRCAAGRRRELAARRTCAGMSRPTSTACSARRRAAAAPGGAHRRCRHAHGDQDRRRARRAAALAPALMTRGVSGRAQAARSRPSPPGRMRRFARLVFIVVHRAALRPGRAGAVGLPPALGARAGARRHARPALRCSRVASACAGRWSGWGRSSSSSARCCRRGATCCRWTWPTNWRKLQDRVPPFPAAQSRALVEKAFGRRIDELFASFDAEPVASASIAQVHFATLQGRPRGGGQGAAPGHAGRSSTTT